MKTQSHNLSAFVLGLAYGLEKIRRIVPSASSELEAFLFDFSTVKAGFYIKNLFGFASRICAHNSWIDDCIKRYEANPVVQEVLLREQAKLMFAVAQKMDIADSFDYSCITEEYRLSAEQIFHQHQLFYQILIRAIYQNNPHLGDEYQLGITFVQKTD